MRRLMIVLCLCALALAGVGSAGAYFTDQVSIAENIIRVGSVELSTEPTSSALSVSALAPGETVTRTVRVANDGSLDAGVVVTGAKKAGFTSLYDSLTCRVTHGAVAVYEGPMSGLRTSPVQIDAGGEEDLTFAVGLPASAGNDVAGDYVKLTLYFDAEQVHP